MYPVCTRPLMCMLLGFEAMHLPPNVALFALEDNQSSAKALEPTPQDFEDTVHARQLKALCRRVGRRMSRQGPGRSPSMGLTHLNAARPREKVEWGPALREFENFVGSRFTPACNTSPSKTPPSKNKSSQD